MARSRASLAGPLRDAARSASAICQPTVKQGLRLVVGSWNTIAMSLPMSLPALRVASSVQQVDAGEAQWLGA